MNHRHKLMIVVCATLALYSTGCRMRSRVAVVEPRYKQANTDYVADERVSVGVGFQRVFRIQHLNRGLTESGLETVQAKIMNVTKGNQILMYRFQWLDKNGMAIDTPTTQWAMEHLKPGEIRFISGVAPTDNAVDFFLSMKQHRAKRR